eukprot:TRINITY_DN15319_c0_g1_i1.p1 TRINITY_DN15319_c0_g1~~TRINITY_DN15319_c0_g1_i1.p1  ORF type:complete len:324 (-),score=64.26 TRINITY_DN15319_c0_g1_i1:71-1042(-)
MDTKMNSLVRQQTLKIFLENEIRRLNIVPPFPNWNSFLDQVSSLFSVAISQETVRVYYNDDENDRVVVNSQLEWEVALSIITTQPIAKIYVENQNNNNNCNMKVGDQNPFPQVRLGRHHQWHMRPRGPYQFHGRHHAWHFRGFSGNRFDFGGNLSESSDVNNNNNKIHDETLEEFRGPRFWRGLPESTNLQCNKKEFKKFRRTMKMAKKAKKLEIKMHKRAFKELEDKNYPVASKLYEAVICLNPSDPLAFYNLACCEALSGASESALTNLALAVENGYSKIAHMDKDSDLDHIRNLPQFHEIRNRILERNNKLEAQLENLTI